MPNAPQSQAPPNPDEPRKCWICFSDETEDTPATSTWVSPCPCVLQAHQSCLLDWIADLQSPKRKKAKKVQCPQCKSDIQVFQPHSLSIELARACQKIAGKLIWPAAGICVVSTVLAGLTVHGCATMGLLLGSSGFRNFVESLQRRQVFLMPSIPVLLIISRTRVGDNVLPLLPLCYLALPRSQRRVSYVWGPWGVPETLMALPALRSLYFGAYRRWALPLEKAWLQEIQPRAGEATEEGGDQAEQENGDEEGQNAGPLDMDFELGVQIEVEAVEEVEPHHHHDHEHNHEELRPANEQVQPNQRPENPEPVDNNANPGANVHDENQNQDVQAQPQQAGAPRQPRQPIIQNFFFAIPGLTRMTIGALAFPWVSYCMGELLKKTLPKAWITPPLPGYWVQARRANVLQTRTGRVLIGGCLFVVLKDTLFFYSKYSMAQNHKKRKVLNYNEITKPWYQKSIDELFSDR